MGCEDWCISNYSEQAHQQIHGMSCQYPQLVQVEYRPFFQPELVMVSVSSITPAVFLRTQSPKIRSALRLPRDWHDLSGLRTAFALSRVQSAKSSREIETPRLFNLSSHQSCWSQRLVAPCTFRPQARVYGTSPCALDQCRTTRWTAFNKLVKAQAVLRDDFQQMPQQESGFK